MSDEHEAVRERFDALHHNAAQDLFRHARVALGGDSSQAHDLVQDVFKAAWEARRRVFRRDLDGQRAWLYVTLHNKVVDAYRKARETPTEVDRLDVLRRRERRPAAALQGVLFGDVLQRCWKVIEAMPPVRQKVIYLRAAEWKTSEIAEHLGISSSTVRDHIKAGVEQLAEAIGPVREIFDDMEDDQCEDGGQQ